MGSTSNFVDSASLIEEKIEEGPLCPMARIQRGAQTPIPTTVHQLFEAQVERAPHLVALLHDGRSLSYAELNIRANRLAHYLRARGVGPGEPVGICVERGFQMVIGLLGIIKAGAAYLPLDPGYPAERLAYMVADARLKVVLTQERLADTLLSVESTVIVVDRILSELDAHSPLNLSPAVTGASSATVVYVIYTSGSTGRPKGTEMQHSAMVNLISWHRQVFGEGSERRVLQFAALSFDVAFQDTFSTLCLGDTLVLLDEWMRRDIRVLAQLLVQGSIERLFVPPLILQSLAEHVTAGGVLPEGLRDVIAAGEQLRISGEIVSFFAALRACRLHNHYGPTETHVVTALTLQGDPRQWPPLPSIGCAITNTQIHILDEYGGPAPAGAAGELHIGGAGVARGYLRRPELTAQRFLADPFNADAKARLYRTGDLARLRDDGMIDYLGRNDDQVKIRGFRIELGEIELQLARHPHVAQVAVVAREDVANERRLIAYVCVREQYTPTPDELRVYLKQNMPEYMVPSAFVVLDILPTTPSGKLDRRSLPTPTHAAYSAQGYEEPRGVIESALASIWRELLRVDRVGRFDSFLELGGDSLLIVRMLERLRQAGLGIDVRSVYANPSLAGLARVLEDGDFSEAAVPLNLIPVESNVITPDMLTLIDLDARQIEWITDRVPGGAANIQDIYPLTPLQEGLLFHHLLSENEGDTYIVMSLLRASSRQRLDGLMAALSRVIERHDVLRTLVLWEQLPRPVQVVCRRVALPVKTIVLGVDTHPLQQLEEWLKPGQYKLDLRQAPIMQLYIAADPNSAQWYAILHLHHIACDHESLEALFEELAICLDGRGVLPDALPYRNHVAQTLDHARTHDAEAFFRAKLADVLESTAPFGLLDVHGSGIGISVEEQRLDSVLAQRVRAQARRLGVSAAIVFHSAWAVVLARTSGRDDVVFGTLLLGRLQGSAGAQHILGMFMNTLPVRLRLRGLTVTELIERTQTELVELLDHEQASLAVAQRCSGIVGSAPLFNALLNYRHSAHGAQGQLQIASQLQMLRLVEWTNYPITCSVDDLGDGFVIAAKTGGQVQPGRLLGYLRTALIGLIEALERASPTSALSIEILPPQERSLILEYFNANQRQYPCEHALIHEVFEEEVERRPESIAVEWRGATLTYSELNRRANQLARYLRARGIGPDQVVGLCAERGLEVIVGVFGILKAGGAYLPLDPAYPAERLARMLADARPGVVVTQERLRSRLAVMDAHIVSLDSEWEQIARNVDDNLDPKATDVLSHHLAYVIYTSGSTGVPKGVMIEHRNVLSLWRGLEHAYRASQPCERVAINASLSFDASVKQLIQLLSGRSLVLIPEEVRSDTSQVLNFLEQARVHATDCTPSQLSSWIAEGLFERAGNALRMVLVGGEPINAELWRQLAASTRIDFYNVYGPTECTVDATFAPLRSAEGEPHIGMPMENKRIYILDSGRQPVPIGVTGEIYIGGSGVGRGYLNQAQMTAQRFCADPFATGTERMYRTGDLGRWRANGTIEYVGRNDQQVKIRGFRIEIGELEAQLLKHQQVRQAVVIVREDIAGDKRLVAYFTASRQVPPAEDLRRHMRDALPEYMVPSAFVVIEEIPLTPSGKLDRRSLPAPDMLAYARGAYEAPRGEMEEMIAELWCQLLHVDQVGRDDDFFALGGHSLIAMQVIVRVRSLLSVQLPMTSLFAHPTVAELAAHVEELRRMQLADRITRGGEDIEKLLQKVAVLSDDDVEELVQQLKRGEV